MGNSRHAAVAGCDPELMADIRKRVSANVSGEFYVDSSCINCDTCRQLAPATFGEQDDYSFVRIQPQTAAAQREALRALIACPTGSIGSEHKNAVREVLNDFPIALAPGVHYCGFHSRKSFGASSYFVQHPGGNWLIDSPRYVEHLVRRFEEMGGIRWIFLSHRDDVADAEKYAHRFGASRIIHRLELSAQPGAERVVNGFEPVQIADDFLIIPTPGHTQGHCVLLFAGTFLFTGDHLWWSPERQRLHASRDVCWYSWPQQTASIRLLENFSFEWILPGHGRRVHLTREEAARQIRELSASMRSS
jgi:glyoxylase-like metal-dependent hydrolase (beta-lactamase superfamily II)/ferredoxin